MPINFFEFNAEDLENLDSNELFELSCKSVEEFSQEKIISFINDVINRTEIVLEGYIDSSSMTPSDNLAFKNLCKCSESLMLIEHWIKTKFQNEETKIILDTSNDDL